MNWKVKAAVQRACDKIPVGKQAVYRHLQRHCGSMVKGYDHSFLLSEAARMARLLRQIEFDIEGSVVMEVGTGWRLDMPIGLYLAGASRIVTCDLNRYLVNSLTLDTVRYACDHAEHIRSLFSFVESAQLESRLAALRRVLTISDLFTTARIEYHAPCDCRATAFSRSKIDVFYSYTVFEHVPGPILEALLRESNRLLSDRGVAFHHIDLGDHYAQVDPSISTVNFLQFSDKDWARYAATPWSYHNRLREDEFRALFHRVPQEIIYWKPEIDERALECLRNGFPLAPQYRQKSPELLSTTILDIVSRRPN